MKKIITVFCICFAIVFAFAPIRVENSVKALESAVPSYFTIYDADNKKSVIFYFSIPEETEMSTIPTARFR